MYVVVLADTHLRRDGLDRMPAAALGEVDKADVVLHAGDVITAEALAALRSRAEVHAVLGNNDSALLGVIPETLLVELGGVRVGMVHDAGRREGRPARLRRRFPTADLVVFGHSHVPCDEVGIDGQRLFNPGSPTERRAQPQRTIGLLHLAGGQIRQHEIRPV